MCLVTDGITTTMKLKSRSKIEPPQFFFQRIQKVHIELLLASMKNYQLLLFLGSQRVLIKLFDYFIHST